MNQTPVSYSYRRLTPPDVALLRDLNAVFAAAFEDASSYLYRPPTDEYLIRLLGRQHVVVIVALAGEQVIGGLVAYVLEKLEQERSEVYIFDLAVSENHRRRGVATSLIDALRAPAAAHGAEVIFVQADADDEPAIALYQSFGIQEAPFHFDIPVSRPVRRPIS